MELQFPNSDGSIFIEGTHHGGVSEWDGVCARVWVGRCTQDWRATLKIYVCMYVHASCHVIQVAMVVFWEILRVVYSKVETCAFRGIEMCLQLWYGGWEGCLPKGSCTAPSLWTGGGIYDTDLRIEWPSTWEYCNSSLSSTLSMFGIDETGHTYMHR